MKAVRIIQEERLPGNRKRREAMKLPWLEYRAHRFQIGEAIADAESVTGCDVKIGLWGGRRIPGLAVVIGKYAGDPDDPELPLYVLSSAMQPKKSATKSQASSPRMVANENVILRLATRIVRQERSIFWNRILAIFAIVMSLTAILVSVRTYFAG